jgi:hypothetical protein
MNILVNMAEDIFHYLEWEILLKPKTISKVTDKNELPEEPKKLE